MNRSKKERDVLASKMHLSKREFERRHDFERRSLFGCCFFVGALLFLWGAVSLLANYGVISQVSFRDFWPLLAMGFGLFLIFKRFFHVNYCW
ncbi:MAG: hypothetical protein ACE5DI_03085 [Candidatus Micrarchaeia archaeon]